MKPGIFGHNRLERKVFWGILLGVFLTGTIWANPDRTYQDQILKEKVILERSLQEYGEALRLIELDLPALKAQEEWLLMKIDRMKDMIDQPAKMELERHLERLRFRMGVEEKEKERMRKLRDANVKRLKALDEEVSRNLRPEERQWWRVGPSVREQASRAASTLEEINLGPAPAQYPIDHTGNDGVWVAGLKPDPEPVSKILNTQTLYVLDSFYLETLQEEIEKKIKEKGIEDWINLQTRESRLVMKVQMPVIFDAGKASLKGKDLSFLKKLTDVLSSYNMRILVEGFSEKPKSAKQISAWELASQRAIAVAQELIRLGLPSAAFTIISHGEHGAPTFNFSKMDTEVNRRVEITVSFRKNAQEKGKGE